MSAYIVSKETINEIVNLISGDSSDRMERHYGKSRLVKLCHAAEKDGLIEPREFIQDTDRWGYGELSVFATLLGRALWRMNINAVAQRYPDSVLATEVNDSGRCAVTGKFQLPGPIPNPRPDHYEFRPIYRDKRTVIGDSYPEFNYQCQEGDVSDSALYRELEVVVGRMAVGVITQECLEGVSYE